MKVGDTVRYRSTTGSFGQIEEIRRTQGRSLRYYVRWHYGRAPDGAALTELSICAAEELLPLERAVFDEYVQARAWSTEQARIRARLEKEPA